MSRYEKLNGAYDCPYCTLKTYCQFHRNGPRVTGDVKVADSRVTMARMYDSIIGSRLDKFKDKFAAALEKHQSVDPSGPDLPRASHDVSPSPRNIHDSSKSKKSKKKRKYEEDRSDYSNDSSSDDDKQGGSRKRHRKHKSSRDEKHKKKKKRQKHSSNFGNQSNSDNEARKNRDKKHKSKRRDRSRSRSRSDDSDHVYYRGGCSDRGSRNRYSVETVD